MNDSPTTEIHDGNGNQASADASDDSARYIDLRERNAIGACNAYFRVRPELDTPDRRDLFMRPTGEVSTHAAALSHAEK